jgi:hypothetical protein
MYIKFQSIRTQIIVKTKKVKEAEKFVFQKIFEYDNCQISEYDYVKSISLFQIPHYYRKFSHCKLKMLFYVKFHINIRLIIN